VITSIGLDHMDWLGDSIAKIGFEKAGVMRKGHPAVLAAKDLPRSVKAHADKVGAKTFMLGEQYHFEQIAGGWSWQGQNRTRRALPLPSMRGSVQLQNAAAALQVIELLEDTFPVDQNAAKSGLIDAKVFGRFDIYQHKARFVVDVGHNPEAVGHLASHLGDLFVPGKVHAVVGMLKDKSIAETLAVIAPRIEQWHLLDLSDNPRGATAERLAECLPAESQKQSYASAKDALDALDTELSSDDLVVVFGSFVTVGATLAWLGEMPT
jgi:dihydrofolate synthase/folylpolyglutamate synthase